MGCYCMPEGGKWPATIMKITNFMFMRQPVWCSLHAARQIQVSLGTVCDGSVLIVCQQDWLKNNYVYTDFCIFLQKLSHGLCQERNV